MQSREGDPNQPESDQVRDSNPRPAPPAADGSASQSTAAANAESSANGERIVAQLRQELAASQDRVLRCQADFDNFRRRSAKEMQELQQYASLNLLRDLLNVRDNLERAIAAAEKTQDSSSLLEGVRMVSAQLAGVFQQHWVQEVGVPGEPFDPQRHEAIGSQPSDEHPAGAICIVAQTGFMLHDRVIRPALVMVSTGPPSPG